MYKKPSNRRSLRILARGSRLSSCQVNEVLQELAPYSKGIEFECEFCSSPGDRDLKRSLRPLEKSDFFTRDIDQKLLAGEANVAVHSAKDLPEPLPKGLTLVALTKGVDSSDLLLFNQPLSDQPLVATSSERREENVKHLFPNARFTEVRGTIDERLCQLDRGDCDGLVVAKAALIRLGLDREGITLPGEVAPLQGRLAIIARVGDLEMEALFGKIDAQAALSGA